MKYVNNAFSLKMLQKDSTIDMTIIDEEEFKTESKDAFSVIGHEDTAKMFDLPLNRQTLHLQKGDVLFVCELNNDTGTRLPVGITEINDLPNGFYFRFLKVVVK